jgi:hypothetical protein
MKAMLNQTINVKMKYENIIKRLIDNEQSRDCVLRAIEYFQQSQPSDISQIMQTTTGPQNLTITTI